jgi:glutathione-specific gamma-glutamylcyclotransferase
MSRWVFAYGSLIWNPGFVSLRSVPARLDGYHRSLCVLSHRYRGTPECLGLVFGLDVGGYCDGIAHEVDDACWAETHAYLTARELVTHVYLECELQALLRGAAKTIPVLTYVVDPAHQQYAGGMPLGEKVRHICQGHGIGGSCTDYVENTALHLAAFGISDPELDRVVAALSQAKSSHSAGQRRSRN